MHDTALAARLARDAGSLLVRLQREAAPEELGTAELKDRGDRESQEFLARGLAEHRPEDAVLSEEAADDRNRLLAERVWIIDPLDGTREFSEGRHDWAVHVALWERGELTAGAVALPGIDALLTSEAQLTNDAQHPSNAEPRRWSRPERIRLAVSRSRATPLVQALAERLGAELVPMGSAGFKAAAVVRGEVDAYVHTGGQYEWDSAAPVAVARAAGLFASRVDGGPLDYNGENPYLPDLVICNPLIAEDLLGGLASIMEEDAR